MAGGLAEVKALVVDDDRDNAELLEFLLVSEGASVRAAGGAGEALAIVETWTPDVLLIDISLPEIDGCALLGMLRQRPSLAPVPAIAVTGHAGERERKSAAAAGFALHLTKPIDFEALVQVIATLLGRGKVAGVSASAGAEGRTRPID